MFPTNTLISVFMEHLYGRSGLKVEPLVFFSRLYFMSIHATSSDTNSKAVLMDPKEPMNYWKGLSMDNLACWA